MEKCSIGLLNNEDCHLKWHTTKVGLRNLDEIQYEERELYKWRAGLHKVIGDIKSICFHHQYTLGPHFVIKIKKCCDPYNLHKKKCKGTNVISLDQANKFEIKNMAVIPGMKLCPGCYIKANKHLNCDDSSRKSTMCPSLKKKNNKRCFDETFCDDSSGGSFMDESFERENSKRCLDETFSAVGISPIKTHSLSKQQRISAGKKKIERVVQNLQDRLASSVGEENCEINYNDINKDTSMNFSKENQNKIKDYDIMMFELKEKFNNVDYYKKIQLLTLKPNSWTITQTATFFNTSTYLVRKALTIKQTKGILALPDKITHKVIKEEILDAVTNFYEDDEFSRVMSGIQNSVNIGGNMDKQKRLLLMDMKELFHKFCNKYPDYKLSFSNFASLRPMCCITKELGRRGMMVVHGEEEY